MRLLSTLICALMLLPGCARAEWRSLGPFGGNARALAHNPRYPDHVLLGSGAGMLYESLDGGRRWEPFAHLGQGDELMVKVLLFDPRNSSTIYVAGWNVSGSGGAFYLTRDGGRSWKEPEGLKGKSIQALAVAASDTKILVAGALDGLYRSYDGGESWEQITPKGDRNLKNFESVAIDPSDPQIIYAGTWHLPWKTSDGGATWSKLKQGVIEDSDVFSIILDHSNPKTVFASACSGIYRSEDGGKLFQKVQGVPNTARRTRVLRQDPEDAKTVYAGTTEGLFKSSDGGTTYKRITPPDFILNDVLVDPRNSQRVLIATDRGGVFASDDGGASFQPSNDGFSERQLTAVIADPKNAADLYAGVLNDKEFGGVFHAHDGLWTQMSHGLGGRDVFDLGWSDLGWSGRGRLAAATNRGIFLFDAKTGDWLPSRIVVPARRMRGRKVAEGTRGLFAGKVSALAMGNRRWYAATEAGLLHSDDEGANWSGGAIGAESSLISVSAHEGTVAAASVHEVWGSTNEGRRWVRQPLPGEVKRVFAVLVTDEGEIWAATGAGALHWSGKSRDDKGGWVASTVGLPARAVTSIREQNGLLLAAIAGSRCWYVSRDRGKSWSASAAADVEVSGAVMQGETVYVTTRHHGVVVRKAAASAAELHEESAASR